MTQPSNEPKETRTELAGSERYSRSMAERRRLLLDVLAEESEPAGLGELAATIAAREDGTDAVDEATAERVAVTLHHVHLPKMGELGILDYDPESHRIDPDGVTTEAVRNRYTDYQ